MRDRLIELIKQARCAKECMGTNDIEVCKATCQTYTTCGIIADYLLANGVIVPPCKVGDKVYVGNFDTTISEIIIGTDITFMCYFDCDWVIENVGCGDCPFADWYTTYEGDIDCQAGGCFSFTEKDIGKTVFLTREETEQASKGGAE